MIRIRLYGLKYINFIYQFNSISASAFIESFKEIQDSETREAITTIGLLPVTKRDIVAGYVATTTEFNISTARSTFPLPISQLENFIKIA